MAQLPILKAKEIIKTLEILGFQRVRQRGSHVRMRHPDGRRVTIPDHGSEDIDRSLLSKILRDAKITSNDFLKSI